MSPATTDTASATTTTTSETIRALPPRDKTATPQIRDDVFELRAQSAAVRDRTAQLADTVGDLHDQIQQFDLNDRAGALLQNEPADLLAVLGDERGFPWSLVGSLVGVSPTAVRKWRRGGALSPDSRARLARLVAFSQIVTELDPRISDVALWLQSPIVAGATTLTPTDLFAIGGDADIALLNRAAQRITPEKLLDQMVPDWRSSSRPDTRHRVVVASDGIPSIVPVD